MATRLTTMADRWQLDVMADVGPPGWGAAALRGAAAGGARLYEVGLDAYLGLERFGLRRRESLPVPVVSVGNLTVGGTGKTPMTRLLCRRFQGAGRRPAILSRGHGGKGAGVRLVSDAHGNIARSAADAGDEPLLLAQSLPGVPVLVGKDRRLSGREALRRFPLDVLVLDDGFQYWQLTRDLDIVLVDALRPFDNGRCLPRGLLREPPGHLRRAGVVVATRADGLNESGRATLREMVDALAPGLPLFFARHGATGFVALGGPCAEMDLLPLDTLADRPVVAWSAIARPDSFAHSLEGTGARLAGHLARADHATPTTGDAAELESLAGETHAEALVMTEKDAVKWSGLGGDFSRPVYALRVEMQVENEVGFLRAVTRRLFGGASEDGARE
jgi:tetraacyldisaccharide 4'-kinase